MYYQGVKLLYTQFPLPEMAANKYPIFILLSVTLSIIPLRLVFFLNSLVNFPPIKPITLLDH